MQRGEARADTEGAATELLGRAGEDRGGRIVLLDEVLQPEKIRERRRENRRAVFQRRTISQRGHRCRARAGIEAPGAVARGDVFEQHPLAHRRLEAAVRPHVDRLGALDGGPQRRPIKAEIGRHAGVGRDAEVVLKEKRIDVGHGNWVLRRLGFEGG